MFGQHIHVGCPSGDDAVYLAHLLTRYIPHFIALSASSPYYQGEDTSFETSRLHAVTAFPLSGHMPFVRDWAEFNGYFDEMKRYGIVESMKDFYWDIRPKPEYGTIEIRVCDTPLTVRARRAARRLRADARRVPPAPSGRASRRATIYLVNGYNRFEACRFGFRGEMVDPYARREAAHRRRHPRHLALVEPHARAARLRRAARARSPRRARRRLRRGLAARAAHGARRAGRRGARCLQPLGAIGRS